MLFLFYLGGAPDPSTALSLGERPVRRPSFWSSCISTTDLRTRGCPFDEHQDHLYSQLWPEGSPEAPGPQLRARRSRGAEGSMGHTQSLRAQGGLGSGSGLFGRLPTVSKSPVPHLQTGEKGGTHRPQDSSRE